VVSLYGSQQEAHGSKLADVDVVLFDIQDVGVRFYTYISTLHYVMEAAAEKQEESGGAGPPEPQRLLCGWPGAGHGVHRSFVGMHPVPLVHGMTIGEFAT
jgi:uncharacterized protein YbbC (DUF1343 family)